MYSGGLPEGPRRTDSRPGKGWCSHRVGASTCGCIHHRVARAVREPSARRLPREEIALEEVDEAETFRDPLKDADVLGKPPASDLGDGHGIQVAAEQDKPVVAPAVEDRRNLGEGAVQRRVAALIEQSVQ